MIPKTGVSTADIRVRKQPSRTYAMDVEGQRIAGFCDGLEAVKQSVYKILSTERYDWLIYSWNYGVELKEFFGQQMSYVTPRIKSRIEEALLMDDRIKEIQSFSVSKTGRSILTATFTVISTEGNFESEVRINV